MGRCVLELAQDPSCVALALHFAGGSTPFGVTTTETLHMLAHGPDKGLAGKITKVSSLEALVACCFHIVIVKMPLGKFSNLNASKLHPVCKLTWLVLGGDPAARSHRVEQFTAL